MRHQKRRYKLSRSTKERHAMLRSLVVGLFLNDSIKTTLAKAKEARRYAERLITIGKDSSLSSRRRAFEFLNDRDSVKSLFDDISPRFLGRAGGYTRILRLGKRSGDGAQMALLELVVKRPPKPKEKPKPEAAPVVEKEKPKVKPERPKGFLGVLRGLFRKKQDKPE